MNDWTPEQWERFLGISDAPTKKLVDIAINEEVGNHYLLREFLDKLGLGLLPELMTPTRRALIVGICAGWAEGWRQADFFWIEQ